MLPVVKKLAKYRPRQLIPIRQKELAMALARLIGNTKNGEDVG